ncbi:MAG: hypothetical protein M3Y72_01430 [Acidobacteriota bacterium]|nr:hypothetical protein [Acidobacteriota bacterium]
MRIDFTQEHVTEVEFVQVFLYFQQSHKFMTQGFAHVDACSSDLDISLVSNSPNQEVLVAYRLRHNERSARALATYTEAGVAKR